jgi:hypothetical protein
MSQTVVIRKALAAANPALFAASQTPVSGTPLTLVGTPTADTQRYVLVTYGNEAAPRTLTLLGVNDAGSPVTEVITIPSGAPGTIASVNNYRTLTSAVPAGGGWTAAMTLGTNTQGSTQWFIPNGEIAPFSLGVAAELISGAANFQIDGTYDSPLAQVSLTIGYAQNPVPVPIVTILPGMGPSGSNIYGSITQPIAGYRLTINSGTGTVQMTANQAGVRN